LFSLRPAGSLQRDYRLLAVLFVSLRYMRSAPVALRSVFTIKTKIPPSLENLLQEGDAPLGCI